MKCNDCNFYIAHAHEEQSSGSSSTKLPFYSEVLYRYSRGEFFGAEPPISLESLYIELAYCNHQMLDMFEQGNSILLLNLSVCVHVASSPP